MEPLKVTRAMEAKLFFVEYYDSTGREKKTRLAYVDGDGWRFFNDLVGGNRATSKAGSQLAKNIDAYVGIDRGDPEEAQQDAPVPTQASLDDGIGVQQL